MTSNRSSSGGLSAAQVAERIARGEVNITDMPTSRPLVDILRENVFTFFNAILTVCFLAVLLLGRPGDGFFFGVVVVNAAIGIVQEVRAKLALDRLAVVGAPETAVRRDGEVRVIPPRDVVLGDTVVLRPGDQVTADSEVMVGTDLLVDESMLTGESDPVAKHEGDRLLSGALIVAGAGESVVIAVGRDSYSSTLSAEIKRHSLVRSELREATNGILVYISWILIPMILILVTGRVFTYGGLDRILDPADGLWQKALLDTVAAVVGIIPEGLVLLTSLAFGVAALQLARDRVLVQELAAVEVLARVDVLCLDKTGTLTTGMIEFHELLPPAGEDHVNAAARGALEVFGSDPGANATAQAILAHFGRSDVDAQRLPFSSGRAFGAIAFGEAEERTTWLLGAPERLLADHPAELERANLLAAAGNRTLALALGSQAPAVYGEDPSLAQRSAPMGLVVFREQVRPGAAATLAYFAEQGVRVIILSGDNPRTVGAIAAELGLSSTPVDASTLSGVAALSAALAASSTFGRVGPEQKREIVRLLRAGGHAVAMTGDGINDAMAIKDADLGIAMGNATPATRAVARLVLLDSRFEVLPQLLGYGRRVIANVERVANLFLAKTVYGMVFALVTAILLWEFPFLPRQLTLVSTLAIGIPSFFLALAPNKRRYRPGVRGRMLRFSIPIGLIAAATVLSVFGVVRTVLPLLQARSLATITLFVVSLWILSVLARPLSGARVALVVAVSVAMMLACFIPMTRDFFKLDIPLNLWLGYALGVAVLGAGAIELCYRRARRSGVVFDRE
jgi:cation-transporting ATPase E